MRSKNNSVSFILPLATSGFSFSLDTRPLGRMFWEALQEPGMGLHKFLPSENKGEQDRKQE